MPIVNLTWTAPTTGEVPDSYQLYRKVGAPTGNENVDGFGTLAANPGSSTDVPTVAGSISTFLRAHTQNSMSYDDNSVAGATTYSYCIKSVKGNLESAQYANSQDGAAGSGDVVYTISTA
jgi:hypothetical protein